MVVNTPKAEILTHKNSKEISDALIGVVKPLQTVNSPTSYVGVLDCPMQVSHLRYVQ